MLKAACSHVDKPTPTMRECILVGTVSTLIGHSSKRSRLIAEFRHAEVFRLFPHVFSDV